MGSRDTAGNANDFFRGIGQTGPGRCEIVGVFYYLGDADPATPETYRLRIRPLAASGVGPDPTTALLDLPLSAPPVWNVNLMFTTPVAVPCARSWFIGIAMPATPRWPADGLEMNAAAYYAGTTGDAPRQGAAKLYWEIDANGNVAQPTPERVLQIGVYTECPVLNLANTLTSNRCTYYNWLLGAGGLWPSNSARSDGIGLWIRDTPTKSVVPGVVLMSAAPAKTPIAFPGVVACAPLWLDPTVLLATPVRAAGTSHGYAIVPLPFLGNGRLRGLSGPLWFQVIVGRTTPGGFPMTNAAATLLHPTL
jgi:hypothetical protein